MAVKKYCKKTFCISIGLVAVVLLACFCGNYAYKNKEINTVYTKTGQLIKMNQNDLIRTSAVIVYGELDRKSQAFAVQSTSGDKSVYEDYYIKPIYIIRGKNEGKDITVRIEGGTANGMTVEDEYAPCIKEGKKYLLFLRKPIPGSYATKGDYYYVNGATQGVYCSEESDDKKTDYTNADKILKEEAQIIMVNQEEKSKYLDLVSVVKKINDYDKNNEFNENILEEEYIENLKYNMEHGFITEDYYEYCINDMKKYATIVK